MGKPVNNEILEQYDKQKSRGQRGFGIFDGQEMNMVHETKEDSILKWLVKYDSNLLLMHHRLPTSTVNVKRAAHPFSTKKFFGKTQYILIHNGHISNAWDLLDDHENLGINYYSFLDDLTFNDSEALLWDFALFMEGKQDKIKARGAMAFICLKLVKGKLEKMYFGRNTNPLVLFRTKEGIALSSEGEGGELIERDKLYTWNYKLKRLTKRPLDFPGYYTPSTYKSTNYTKPIGAWDDDELYGWNFQNEIARKWAIEKGYTPKKLIDFEEDEDGAYQMGEDGNLKLLEAGAGYDEDYEPEIRASQAPTDSELEKEYLMYLRKAHGVFETAYWLIEKDYDDEIGYPDTLWHNKRLYLLESVMEMINTDPEYVSSTATTSMELA